LDFERERTFDAVVGSLGDSGSGNSGQPGEKLHHTLGARQDLLKFMDNVDVSRFRHAPILLRQPIGWTSRPAVSVNLAGGPDGLAEKPENSPGCHAPGLRRTTPFSRYRPPARRPKAQVCDEFHLQYSAIWLGGPQSLVHYGRAGLDIIRPSTHLVKR